MRYITLIRSLFVLLSASASALATVNEVDNKQEREKQKFKKIDNYVRRGSGDTSSQRQGKNNSSSKKKSQDGSQHGILRRLQKNRELSFLGNLLLDMLCKVADSNGDCDIEPNTSNTVIEPNTSNNVIEPDTSNNVIVSKDSLNEPVSLMEVTQVRNFPNLGMKKDGKSSPMLPSSPSEYAQTYNRMISIGNVGKVSSRNELPDVYGRMSLVGATRESLSSSGGERIRVAMPDSDSTKRVPFKGPITGWDSVATSEMMRTINYDSKEFRRVPYRGPVPVNNPNRGY